MAESFQLERDSGFSEDKSDKGMEREVVAANPTEQRYF